jgi:hypothetical protein
MPQIQKNVPVGSKKLFKSNIAVKCKVLSCASGAWNVECGMWNVERGACGAGGRGEGRGERTSSGRVFEQSSGRGGENCALCIVVHLYG